MLEIPSKRALRVVLSDLQVIGLTARMEAYNIVLCIVSVCAVLELFFTGSVKRQSLPHPGRPNLSFNPKNMASMGIVEVAWSGVSEADLSRPVTERLCQQDAHCKEVKLSVWVGVFAKDGAKIKVPRTTGPQGYPAEPRKYGCCRQC